MQRMAMALVVGALLTLSACGKTRSTDDQANGAGTPTAALTPPVSTAAPHATAVERQEVGLAPTSTVKKTHLNEDGSETVDETAVDSGAHNSLLAAVAATVAAATPSAVAAGVAGAPSAWQEGVNYTRLVPAQPTSVAAGQVEVLEFFWYGCPHCYALDSQVEAWKKSKPPYVAFTRVPVMWSEGHRSTARLFYTLFYMGKLDQFHGDVFKEIHVNGDPLVATDPTDEAANERLQTTFIKRLGISEDDFKKTYHSFQVDTALQRADQLGRRYRIDGVPTFVVDGKYIADVRSAQSPERLISLIDDLSMQEHKH